MYVNEVKLVGRLAVVPQVTTFDTGRQVAKLLVTVRAERPRRRVDVIPVTVFDDVDRVAGYPAGTPVEIHGTVQRRFWANPGRSRIEVVADTAHRREGD